MTGIRIIAVLGSSKSGKSTLASYMCRAHGFERMRFAQPLKDMLVTMGLSPEQVDGPQEVRETPSDLLCGRTPRYAMQTLGSEWRDMIHKGLWAKIIRSRMVKAIEQGQTKFVIDDMRFPHEATMFRELGCEIWAIRRPEVEPTRWSILWSRLPLPKTLRSVVSLVFELHSFHISETEWFKIERDAEIKNDGTIDELYFQAEGLLAC